MTNHYTVLDDGQSFEIRGAETPPTEGIWLDAASLQSELGWQLKPEGLCRGEVCIPVRNRDAWVAGDAVELSGFAAALGKPVATNASERAAALGTAVADRAAALDTLVAPDFSLPDLSGKLHSLSEHRGKKVLLIAYASW